MPPLGAHMSIAGGLHKAVEQAAAAGCDCVQIFTANPRQFPKTPTSRPLMAQAVGKSSKSGANRTTATKHRSTASAENLPLPADVAEQFTSALRRLQINHPISHDSYLINLAAPDDNAWLRSIDAFELELRRAAQLGIFGVVMHPGAFTTSSEQAGLARVAAAFDEVHARLPELTTLTLIETTAGQGSSLGWKFEHLESIFAQVAEPQRLGVCVDTCHVFAAGYPLATPREYAHTMSQLDAAVGLDRVKAFHLNDSKVPLGKRVDRHAHIGRGELGLEPFRHLLNDPRFAQVPMYLETPKGKEGGQDLDQINLGTLRSLID